MSWESSDRVSARGAAPAGSASIYPLRKISSDLILPLSMKSAMGAEDVWRRVFMTMTHTKMRTRTKTEVQK